MREASHIFFNKKYWHIWDINVWNFNEALTNDVVSFEKPGPDLYQAPHNVASDQVTGFSIQKKNKSDKINPTPLKWQMHSSNI